MSRARPRTEPQRAALIFLAPFLLIALVFVLYPLAQSTVLAFQQTYGPGTKTFVGVSNFTTMMGDSVFWTAVRNTLVYTLGSLFIQLPLALLLAMALNSPKLRGRGLYLGLELVRDRATKEPFDPALKLHAGLKAQAMDRGLIYYPGGGTADGVQGDHILLAPPFIIEKPEIDELVDRLGAAIDAAIKDAC